MNVLFVSKEYPGRFAPLAAELARTPGWHSEFLCGKVHGPADEESVHLYLPDMPAKADAHFLSRLYDQQCRDAEAIYEAARSSCRRTPDIVVDAAGTGSCLPLRDLFRCPVVGYFEYFHQPGKAAPITRSRQQMTDREQLRLRTANAATLLDLVNCDCGFTSTQFQHSLLPKEFSYKVRVLHEGCDVRVFRRRTDVPRVLGRKQIAPEKRIVTFLANRLNSSSGYETFIETSQEIAERYPDVVFVVCGGDVPAPEVEGQKPETVRTRFLRERKELSARFIFLDGVSDAKLAALLSLSDLVLHLPVPGPPSPALIAAMACECVILASDFPPVREFIRHRQNGLLAGHYSTMALADEAVRVLQSPRDFRVLGARARAFVTQHLSLNSTISPFRELLRTAGRRLPDQFSDEIFSLEAQEENAAEGEA